MNCLFACLKKDARLFFGSIAGAVLSLLFPVIVFLLLLTGGGELLSASTQIRPFSVAIRDLDQTMMSRVLIEQLDTVELFSEVMNVDVASDEELFDRGAAAVITIPKDFFYLAYDMKSDIGISLNSDMPAEATIVRTFAVSIMEIVTQNQTAAQVDKMLAGQDFVSDDVKAEAARGIFRDAFELLGMMQLETMAASAVDSSTTMLLACVISLFVMLIPLQVLSTWTEDRSAGILPRYIAAGGSVSAVVTSKFLAAILLTCIPLVAVMFLVSPELAPKLLLLALILFTSSFGLFFPFAVLSTQSNRLLMFGNLYILVSILLGGVIYPVSLLPGGLAWIRYAMLPYYALCGVQGISVLGSVSALHLLPALTVGVCGLVIGMLLVIRVRRQT